MIFTFKTVVLDHLGKKSVSFAVETNVLTSLCEHWALPDNTARCL